MPQKSQANKSLYSWLWWAIVVAIQAVLLYLIWTGFGITPQLFVARIDNKSFLVFFGYLSSLIASIWVASRSRAWWALGVQIALPLMFICYSLRPIAVYKPSEYQHLIGRDIREVREELDTRHAITSHESGGGKSWSNLSLSGMNIIYNDDRQITKVEPHRRY